MTKRDHAHFQASRADSLAPLACGFCVAACNRSSQRALRTKAL